MGEILICIGAHSTPSGWKAVKGDSGKTFYFHAGQNKSQWTKPDELKTAAELAEREAQRPVVLNVADVQPVLATETNAVPVVAGIAVVVKK